MLYNEMTEKELINKINEKNKEYSFIRFDENGFKKSNSKFFLSHNICGRKLKFSYSNFVGNNRECKFCYGNSVDTQKFKERVDRITMGEYKVLGEYTRSHDNIELLHTKCNIPFNVTPNNFLSHNNRCPNCNKLEAYTEDSTRLKISEVDPDYELVKIHELGVRGKVDIRHKKCNEIFTCHLRNFITNGRKCIPCNPTKMFKAVRDLKVNKKLKII